ncbi:MAG: HlyD family efflux transporter periplasmic adaptor subunit, partial [Kofleriaceae bacterium]
KGARVEEVARAEARLAQATQAIELDDHRIGKRTLAAPADGVVQDIYLETGEVAGAGVPVLAIADVRRPYADVFVPVADAAGIKVGDPAQLRLEGAPASELEVRGVVELVYAAAEFTPRFVFSPRERPNLMMRVRVRIDDRDGRLHAGLPAYAVLGRLGDEARR